MRDVACRLTPDNDFPAFALRAGHPDVRLSFQDEGEVRWHPK